MLFNASVPFDFQQREHDSLVKALSIAMPGAATDGVLVLSPVINATDSLTLGSRRGRRLRGGVGGGGRRLQQVAGVCGVGCGGVGCGGVVLMCLEEIV